jgi:hypothetical protein
MGVKAVALLVALAFPACSKRAAEPPPPASSGALPNAPPNATGAFAAGRESQREALPVPLAEESEVPDEPDQPIVPVPAPADDGGFSL